jgi:hypothetical protein
VATVLGGNQIYSLHVASDPDPITRMGFDSHELEIRVPEGTYTHFAATFSSTRGYFVPDEGTPVETSEGVRLGVYLSGGILDDKGCIVRGANTFSLYVRISAGGMFDQDTLLGDYEIVAPHGVLHKEHGILEHVLSLAVSFGDALASVLHYKYLEGEIGAPNWYEIKEASALVAGDFPTFNGYYDVREVFPKKIYDVYGDMRALVIFNKRYMVPTVGRLNDVHPHDREGNELSITLPECLKLRGYRYFADGRRWWVERQQVLLEYNPHSMSVLDKLSCDNRIRLLLEEGYVVRMNGEIVESPEQLAHHQIFTCQYQTWKVVTLLRGLGFQQERKEDGDFFTSRSVVTCVFSDWYSPGRSVRKTKKGRTESSEYLVAFSFLDPRGHTDVLVWRGSSTNEDSLYCPVALSTLEDWENMLGKGTIEDYDLWFEYNSVIL